MVGGQRAANDISITTANPLAAVNAIAAAAAVVYTNNYRRHAPGDSYKVYLSSPLVALIFTR